jgi:hypothetical protein
MKNKEKKNKFWGMTKADILLGLAFLLAGAFCFGGLIYLNQQPAGQLEVKVAGEIKAIYLLSEDQEVTLKELGENTFQIRDGVVEMVHADCPDQYCVHHRPISKNGESIICLPNQVVITIRGGEEPVVDGTTN